jgi:hypothetical protein
MRRFIIREILKLSGEAILLTTIVAVVIGIIGYVRKWDSSIAYSNAFFVVGCLFIIAGGLSRLAAAQDWNTFQLFSAESFRGMSASEQANFVVEASSPIRRVVLGVLTGIFLLLLSAIAAYLF